MIEQFITSSLLLVLGYAYPAFQCFKSVDSNRVDNISELRFWCQYWIVVAVITVLEKIGDVFISWLPMYGEMKLALFIYLWFPETKGTGFVYDKLVQPYVSRHETDIDKSLLEFREKAWNLTIYYWNNCTELGSTKVLDFLHFVGSQTSRVTQANSSQNLMNHLPNEAPPPTPANRPYNNAPPAPPPPRPSRPYNTPPPASRPYNAPPSPSTPYETPPPPPSSRSLSIFRRSRPDGRRPPDRPPSTFYRNQTPKPESIRVQLHDESKYVRPEDVLIEDSKT